MWRWRKEFSINLMVSERVFGRGISAALYSRLEIYPPLQIVWVYNLLLRVCQLLCVRLLFLRVILWVVRCLVACKTRLIVPTLLLRQTRTDNILGPYSSGPLSHLVHHLFDGFCFTWMRFNSTHCWMTYWGPIRQPMECIHVTMTRGIHISHRWCPWRWRSLAWAPKQSSSATSGPRLGSVGIPRRPERSRNGRQSPPMIVLRDVVNS